MVGDYVLAVNGTDVTSIPHSEAANLARQGRHRNARLAPGGVSAAQVCSH